MASTFHIYSTTKSSWLSLDPSFFRITTVTQWQSTLNVMPICWLHLVCLGSMNMILMEKHSSNEMIQGILPMFCWICLHKESSYPVDMATFQNLPNHQIWRLLGVTSSPKCLRKTLQEIEKIWKCVFDTKYTTYSVGVITQHQARICPQALRVCGKTRKSSDWQTPSSNIDFVRVAYCTNFYLYRPDSC